MPYKKRHTISEEALVALLQSKDEKGIEILYDNYSASVLGIIFRIVQDTEISEDVLQEAYIKIWNSAAQYDATKGRLFTWMINIARHCAIDKVRSKEFNKSLKNQSLENSVSNSIQAKNTDSTNPELIGLKELVEKLDPEQKKIIDLLYFGGFTQEEVSQKLEIPLGTVKTRCRLALLSLRKQFEVADSYK